MGVFLLVPVVFTMAAFLGADFSHQRQDPMPKRPSAITLPSPRLDGTISVERAILNRRSVRDFAPTALSLESISQLCWAAQGQTRSDGRRASPSAGALYPLELYLAVEDVSGLASGLYRYQSSDHSLALVRPGGWRKNLSEAALGQESVHDAPATFIITAVPARTTRKYGERGVRYIHMEAGHAAENMALQAVALGLGCVTVGAFRDTELSQVLELSPEEVPLYLLPVGYPSTRQ